MCRVFFIHAHVEDVARTGTCAITISAPTRNTPANRSLTFVWYPGASCWQLTAPSLGDRGNPISARTSGKSWEHFLLQRFGLEPDTDLLQRALNESPYGLDALARQRNGVLYERVSCDVTRKFACAIGHNDGALPGGHIREVRRANNVVYLKRR